MGVETRLETETKSRDSITAYILHSPFHNYFENYTAFMIMAQGRNYQKFFVISVLKLNMAKNVAIC